MGQFVSGNYVVSRNLCDLKNSRARTMGYLRLFVFTCDYMCNSVIRVVLVITERKSLFRNQYLMRKFPCMCLSNIITVIVIHYKAFII